MYKIDTVDMATANGGNMMHTHSVHGEVTWEFKNAALLKLRGLAILAITVRHAIGRHSIRLLDFKSLVKWLTFVEHPNIILMFPSRDRYGRFTLQLLQQFTSPDIDSHEATARFTVFICGAPSSAAKKVEQRCFHVIH